MPPQGKGCGSSSSAAEAVSAAAARQEAGQQRADGGRGFPTLWCTPWDAISRHPHNPLLIKSLTALVVLTWPGHEAPVESACLRHRAGRARRARPRRPAPGHRGRARRHGQPPRARARLARLPGDGTGREGDQACGPAVAALGRRLRAPHRRRGHRESRAAPAGAGGVHDRGGRPEGGGRSRERRRRRRPREQPPAAAATAAAPAARSTPRQSGPSGGN